jgi:phosphatidylinositol-4,5-bisphosphate 3-kinase
MGIGDRHNGNIMITHDGHLFHIDFGHILGNFKSKFGVKRERAALVFTPEMAYVIGGKLYQKSKEYKAFLQLSARAFTSLRNHASLFINLFSLV